MDSADETTPSWKTACSDPGGRGGRTCRRGTPRYEQSTAAVSAKEMDGRNLSVGIRPTLAGPDFPERQEGAPRWR